MACGIQLWLRESLPGLRAIKEVNTKSSGVIAPDPSLDTVFEIEALGNYDYYVFRDNCLVGSILLGDASRSTIVQKLIETRQDCSQWLRPGADADQIRNRIQELA